MIYDYLQMIVPRDYSEILVCSFLVFHSPQGFVMIQALADGGVKMGLNRDQSIRLAAQSLLVIITFVL